MADLNDLFVFGSMRDLDVLGVVLGRPFEASRMRPAKLPGYRIGRVPEESYPLLVRDDHADAPGDVIEGLSELDLARVHFFEGDEYELNRCVVLIETRYRREVLFCDNFAHERESVTASWALAQWRASEKSRFIDVARKYMSFFGRGTQEEADALWLTLETNARGRSSAA